MNASALQELAARAGIEVGYRDTWGEEHQSSPATVRAVLGAMGLPANSEADIASSLTRTGTLANGPLNGAASDGETAARAWRPKVLENNGRRWGVAVQLYALRSTRTWGIGDFSALAELLRGAAELGASAVGVNPLHALFPTRPEHASPYSPSSRRFINPLYLDVQAMEDFAACPEAQAVVAESDFQARLRDARGALQVQYRAVAGLKYPLLFALYDRFRADCLTSDAGPRSRAFRAFQAREGTALRHFATFQALSEVRVEIDWRQWPAHLRDPDSQAVKMFAAETAFSRVIECHEYLQWQAALQLEQVRETARACNMSIGLYTDLAVGADPTGAEAWSGQAFLASGAAVGAPPDELNMLGQNWGMPPPDPLALRRFGCAFLAELWQANMRCAGALRIDHIMGLMRLYWIPRGTPANEGAYVRYPWRELLGTLAAQSRRQRCMVVGEDLGTVPEGLREALREAGILSYRLLYFERQGECFSAPHEYPADALCAVGTHDLPPLAMWWAGEDIALRDRLELWPDVDRRRTAVEARQRDRGALLAALQQEGLDPGEASTTAPIDEVYIYLARTPCKLLMVQLEDVLALQVQTNVPGTTDEHPNWRRRLPCSIDETLACPRMQRIAAIMADEGRSDR